MFTPYRLLNVALFVVAFVGGLFVGHRVSPPGPTREVIADTSAIIQKTTRKEHEEEHVEADKSEHVRTVVVEKVRWLPGGGVEKEKTETTTNDAESRSHVDLVAGSDDTMELDMTETHTKETLRLEPQWSVFVLFGGNVHRLIDNPSSIATPSTAAVVGGVVTRKITEHTAAGLWATWETDRATPSAAGLAVGGTF